MKYLCLIYSEEKQRAAIPKEELENLKREYFKFTDSIRQSGQYLGGEALQPVQTAKTVRIRNGKLLATDGPFAETKEQLGGFYLIDADDLNEAVEVASRIPATRQGCVEVRPIMEFERE
jgi:hypothetical protein